MHNISDGYGQQDLNLVWKRDGHPVKKYEDIEMAQFRLTDILHGNRTVGSNHGIMF